MELTQSRIKELYDYDGVKLLRKESRNGQDQGSEPGFESSGGYIQLSVDGKTYMYHHIVWLWETGRLPSMQIDHMDRNKKNNSISNLRECTATVNSQNRPLRSDNKSGTNGVYLNSKGKLSIDGIKIVGQNSKTGLYGGDGADLRSYGNRGRYLI